jgi:kinesin family protein 5
MTRILKESLGGNAKTFLVICCSTMLSDIDETISTLHFGSCAASVKNSATINKELTYLELKQQLMNATTELTQYK